MEARMVGVLSEQVLDGRALVQIARLWARRQSARIFGTDGSTAVTLLRGEASNRASLGALMRMLYSGVGKVDVLPAAGPGAPERLGAHLWAEAAAVAEPERVHRALRCGVVISNGVDRSLGRLPLCHSTRRLLGQGWSGADTLDALLQRVGVTLEEVADDLARLCALGLVRLAPIVTLRNTTTSRHGFLDEEAVVDERMVDAQLRRLRREVARMESLDPWTALGLSPEMDEQRQRRACLRVEHQVLELLADPHLPAACRGLAERLYECTFEATARVREGGHAPTADTLDRLELLLSS